MIMQFKTSNGRIVEGDELQRALDAVANDWCDMTKAVYKEDKYASHVTKSKKIELLNKGLDFAESIRQGNVCYGFTIWQRVNTYLTGDFVALLP